MTAGLSLNITRVLEDQAYVGMISSGGGTTSDFHFCQLYNPAGSGVRLIVQGLSASLFANDGIIFLGPWHERIGTVYSQLPAAKNGLDQTKSKAELRVHHADASFGSVVAGFNAKAAESVSFGLCDYPMVIPPEHGLLIREGGAGAGLRVSLQWLEM